MPSLFFQCIIVMSSLTLRVAPLAPRLVVFDLDATLWSPELYTLRKVEREGSAPRAGSDVKLYTDVKPILEMLTLTFPDTKLAIASRTHQGLWARDLIKQFDLPIPPSLTEIYTGSKTKHFASLAKKTKLPYTDMLFFDDARSGKYGNCEAVSNMGVLSAYCPKPNGITKQIFKHAMERFAAGDRGVIVDPPAVPAAAPSMKRGRVKNYNTSKNYGFVEVGGEKDVFFHASVVTDSNIPSNGDEVELVVGMSRGKTAATSLTVISPSSPHDSAIPTITMPCFSMSQPFAAFLCNGVKTIESRNHAMLQAVQPGSNVLLHINSKVYPDGGDHVSILNDAGISDVESASEIRVGGGGSICAIIKVGETRLTTLEERSDLNAVRGVVAFAEKAGKYQTEIRGVEYLKRGVPTKGKGGVWQAEVPRDVVPEGWRDGV